MFLENDSSDLIPESGMPKSCSQKFGVSSISPKGSCFFATRGAAAFEVSHFATCCANDSRVNCNARPD
jgi:hypothetical protein